MPKRHKRRYGITTRIIRREYHEVARIDHMDERVAWRVAELGITYEEFARRVGVKRQCVMSRLRYDPTVSSSLLERIMAALEMTSMDDWKKSYPVPGRIHEQCAAKLAPKPTK